MRRALLITDLDGTLVPVHQPLSADCVALMRELIRIGVRIAVVTGSSANSVLRRVPDGFGTFGSVVDWYTNNGGVCFRIRPDGCPEYEFDRSGEYARYRPGVYRELDRFLRERGCAQWEFAPGDRAPADRVSVDEKECQTTVTLPGLPALRRQLTAELGSRLRARYGTALSVHAAGRRSVDITLATVTKHGAVEHLLAKQQVRGPVLGGDVVIAGDSFGQDGADRQLLHPLLAGALILCAGPNAPPVPGGCRIRMLTGPVEVRSFLRAHYDIPRRKQFLDPRRMAVSD